MSMMTCRLTHEASEADIVRNADVAADTIAPVAVAVEAEATLDRQ
jgi:hypothetical protein